MRYLYNCCDWTSIESKIFSFPYNNYSEFFIRHILYEAWLKYQLIHRSPIKTAPTVYALPSSNEQSNTSLISYDSL